MRGWGPNQPCCAQRARPGLRPDRESCPNKLPQQAACPCMACLPPPLGLLQPETVQLEAGRQADFQRPGGGCSFWTQSDLVEYCLSGRGAGAVKGGNIEIVRHKLWPVASLSILELRPCVTRFGLFLFFWSVFFFSLAFALLSPLSPCFFLSPFFVFRFFFLLSFS